MKSVAIIGAGITGLTAAFYLKRKGISVTIYEARGRVGGAIQSARQNGFLAEFGPNTILETSPKISRLVRDLNLESHRLETNPKADLRFVVRDKKPVATPSSPLGFFTTKLFSLRAKLAVLREPFIPPRRDGTEESVAEFVLRRLNQEFLDRAIDPLIAGIYAGDPQKLSVRHAFPKLFEAEQKYGSLVRGQIFGPGERKKNGEISRRDAKMFSFDEGLQVLPDTLAAQLGDSIKLKTSIVKIVQTQNDWTLTLRENENEFHAEHSAVIYCGTADKLAELEIEGGAGSPLPADGAHGVTRTTNKIDFSTFSEIRQPPVASVVLGFRREDVAHPCTGFGMLIPRVENFKILGTIFSSALFPNRAPAGHILLTSYVGGERQPELASLLPEKMIELVCNDLRVLLGAKGEPTFSHCAFFPKAIPQYNVGYGKFKNLLNEIETNVAGLFFAGHYRDGVSLGDSIVSGCNAAERVATFINLTEENRRI